MQQGERMPPARRIDPEYSFRFPIGEIKSDYGSAESAFSAGDFMIAAQLAEPGSELRGCSLVLAGLVDQGLAELERMEPKSERAVLSRALAWWQLGRPDRARNVLNGTGSTARSKKIESFRQLLDREEIVFFVTGAMLPVFRDQHSPSLTAPSYSYGQITTRYVASQMAENAYDWCQEQPFDEFIASLPKAEQPDLLFALSPQWLLPRNFHRVTQPKLLWCHDTDMFVYRASSVFRQYDLGICGCSQEHFELSRGAGLYSVANLMSNPLNMPFADSRPSVEKNIDVVFSGSSLDHFHSEKSRFIYQLAELNGDYAIRIIDGYLPEAEYFEILSRAKFLTIIGRQAGAPSPRWRDALANGSAVLFPEGTFYDHVSSECRPYSADSIVADIRKHLSDWKSDSRNPSGRSGGGVFYEKEERYRQPREKLFEEQLKYAAFMGLVWRDIRAEHTAERRVVWLTPCIDWTIYGRDNVREKIASVARCVEDDMPGDEIGYNDAALLFAKLALTFPEDERSASWASTADQLFAAGVKAHRRSLLLAFNRAHWEMFKPAGDQNCAIEQFETIIGQFDELEFNPRNADVGLPYTLLDRDPVFPYYEYGDTATVALVREGGRGSPSASRLAEQRLRSMIQAACHGYVGWHRLQKGALAEALDRLDVARRIALAGLPLLRLLVEARLSRCVEHKEVEARQAERLSEDYFELVSRYPTALLTHIAAIVPILVRFGLQKDARTLLEGWYRLGNIVQSGREMRSKYHQPQALEVLLHFKRLLPDELRDRMRNRAGDGPRELTQLERAMVDAARHYSSKRVQRRLRSAQWWLVLSGEVPRVREAVSWALVWRAFVIWGTLPNHAKWQMVKKAWAWRRNSNLRQVVIRAQSWAISSIAARGIG